MTRIGKAPEDCPSRGGGLGRKAEAGVGEAPGALPGWGGGGGGTGGTGAAAGAGALDGARLEPVGENANRHGIAIAAGMGRYGHREAFRACATARRPGESA